MRISCKYELDDTEQNSGDRGRLVIQSDLFEGVKELSLSEFEEYYRRSENIGISSFDENKKKIQNPEMVYSNVDGNGEGASPVLSFILDGLSLNGDEYREGEELLVESNYHKFLQVPWERSSTRNVCVIRKVLSSKKCHYETREDNLMAILSFATKYGDKSGGEIKKKGIEEILCIGRYVIDAEPSFWNIHNVLYVNHMTKEKLIKLSWKDYNYLHFIMHGVPSGALILENAKLEDYKNGYPINIEEILKLFKKRKRFLLMFFSSCYSSGGSDSSGSLAFQIVRNGIAKYSIGYPRGIFEENAKEFANCFYQYLSNVVREDFVGFSFIEHAYRKTIENYLSKFPESKSKSMIPELYIN